MHFARRSTIGLVLAMATAGPAAAAEGLKVVASFSILGDLVRQVGGPQVELTTLVGPDGDAHVYQPSPADARAVARADLVIVNGLGFEGWLDRLVAASGFKGPVVVASHGIQPLTQDDDHDDQEAAGHSAAEHEATEHAAAEDHEHGGADPHAWQSVANASAYVRRIAEALAEADKRNAASYLNRAAQFRQQLDALDAEIRTSTAAIPPARRKIITSHGAFAYFGAAYGLEFVAPVGLSTEAEASAADVAALIRQIRATGAQAIFVENVTDPRLIQQIARETGAKVGGTLYSDALSPSNGPAGSYLDMMRFNTRSLAGALGS